MARKDDSAVRPDPDPGDLPPEEAVAEAEARPKPESETPDPAMSPEFTGQHPLEHRRPKPRQDWQKPEEGELELVDPDGGRWAPIACGVHRSAPTFREPDGFQPDCSACENELNSTLESIHKYATV
jgi:hypothetical protein